MVYVFHTFGRDFTIGNGFVRFYYLISFIN